MATDNKTGIWWRYLLLLVIIGFAGSATHFASQALRGHPLDPNYFWTEWSPFGMFGGRLYNGKGGANWKIGEPKANTWNADELRKLSEVRQFALELVNRDLLSLCNEPERALHDAK